MRTWSKGRKAHNAYPFKIVRGAVTFIKNYASVFGLPQPAALCGRANQAPTYLPAHQNHKIIHQKYREERTKETSHLCSIEVSLMFGMCVYPTSSLRLLEQTA